MPSALIPLAEAPLLPALVGLLGVVVGAAVNGYAQYYIQRRDAASELLSHSRLAGADLSRARGVVQQFIDGEMRDPAAWADELASPAWSEGRGVLAEGLEDSDWDKVRTAFDAIAGFRRGLDTSARAETRFAEERRAAERVRESIDEATKVLASERSGRSRRTRRRVVRRR